MEIFSIVILSLIAIILLISNLYLFVYYSNPDDNSACSGVISKIIVIAAMNLSWIQLLLLPLDVTNSRGGGLGLNMDMAWIVVYIIIAALMILVLPIISAYNECDDDWTLWEKFKYSMCNSIVAIALVITLICVSFFFLSKAEIPVRKTYCPIANFQKSNASVFKTTNCHTEDTNLTLTVSFPIYAIAILSFLSWFIFICFGSIGLAALPLDCFYTYCTRPQIISKDDLEKKKKTLISQVKDVKIIANQAKEFEYDEVMKKSSKIVYIKKLINKN